MPWRVTEPLPSGSAEIPAPAPAAVATTADKSDKADKIDKADKSGDKSADKKADAKADGSPPNNWQSVFGGPAWTWDARRGQYYMHNFLASQPQLNVRNPEVQDALIAAARFWLRVMCCGGSGCALTS